jgi:hypothetical protein
MEAKESHESRQELEVQNIDEKANQKKFETLEKGVETPKKSQQEVKDLVVEEEIVPIMAFKSTSVMSAPTV